MNYTQYKKPENISRDAETGDAREEDALSPVLELILNDEQYGNRG